MTVVHLVPRMEQGGVESVVVNLNRALVSASHKSMVISSGGRLAEKITSDGGVHFTLDVKSKNPLTYFSRALKLRRLLKRIAADSSSLLVCAHSRVPAWLFVFANRTLHLPWISYAHGANSVSRYSAIMTKGDGVVAPSDFLARFLCENYSDDTLPHRLEVISPSVDLRRYDPDALDKSAVDELRESWGVKENSFVAMSVGRISPIKGFDNVIRDFAANTAKSDGEAKLVIVGGADKRHKLHLDELKNLTRSLGVSSKVVFAGQQSRIPECLSIASEVVCGNTVKPESFGLSVCEALAMGKRVRLLREFGGAAEILEKVKRLGAANPRDAVRELFGFEAIAAKTLRSYEEILQRHKRR